jgi:Putative zinc-finger
VITCWRFRLRKRLLRYLEGTLGPREVMQVEQHLLDCEAYRALLLRLRTGHYWAQQLATSAPESVLASHFEAISKAAEQSAHGLRSPARQDWIERLATPRIVSVLGVLVVLQLVLLVVLNSSLLFGKRVVKRDGPAALAALDLAGFRPLRLDQFSSNTQPHVVTEGYVEDVHPDADEGTIAFKLVEHPDHPGPFVVCEIVSPVRLAPPHEGSHIRVYGVSRYDAQSNRRWYEVNPVLDMITVGP